MKRRNFIKIAAATLAFCILPLKEFTPRPVLLEEYYVGMLDKITNTGYRVHRGDVFSFTRENIRIDKLGRIRCDCHIEHKGNLHSIAINVPYSLEGVDIHPA